jgi:hypothetical protein
MEKKFTCIKERHDRTEKGESWTYWYEPIEDIGGAEMQLKVTTTDPYALESEFGLPTNKGDSVMVNTGQKNTQGTLPKEQKEDD